MVGAAGFQPASRPLKEVSSEQLSYAPIFRTRSNLVLLAGFEPASVSLRKRYNSTIRQQRGTGGGARSHEQLSSRVYSGYKSPLLARGLQQNLSIIRTWRSLLCAFFRNNKVRSRPDFRGLPVCAVTGRSTAETWCQRMNSNHLLRLYEGLDYPLRLRWRVLSLSTIVLKRRTEWHGTGKSNSALRFWRPL